VNKPFGNSDPKLSDYVARVYAPEDEVLAEIRKRSAAAGLPDIQVAALDAQHLEVLARAAQARKAVEIGTLGGYSGVALLRGMGPDGELDSIELSERHAEVARESFRRAGVAARARVHVGLAGDVLPKLAARGPFDLVFIDADKANYIAYYEAASGLLAPNGLIAIDNVLWSAACSNPRRRTTARSLTSTATCSRTTASRTSSSPSATA
jgi:caffeoyl-CoA O-methyltransferase